MTSPPYYALRDYGMEAQIGRETTPKEYISRLTEVFTEVRRVLRPDGTLWLNISDTYAGKGNQGDFIDPKNPNGRNGQAVALNNKVEGCKPKDMIGIPWMLAFALHDTGWYLRNDIIWMKDNPMPESVKDRCARCYEHIFLFSKSKKYFFDYKAISEPITPATAERLKRGMKGGNKYGKPVPGRPQPQSINRPREHGEIKGADINPLRNKRDVWKISTVPFKGGHYAAYPPKLVETCLLAGCPEGGMPFSLKRRKPPLQSLSRTVPSRPRSGCRSSKGSPRRRMSVWMPPVKSCPRTRSSRKSAPSMKKPARAKPAFTLRMS